MSFSRRLEASDAGGGAHSDSDRCAAGRPVLGCRSGEDGTASGVLPVVTVRCSGMRRAAAWRSSSACVAWKVSYGQGYQSAENPFSASENSDVGA